MKQTMTLAKKILEDSCPDLSASWHRRHMSKVAEALPKAMQFRVDDRVKDYVAQKWKVPLEGLLKFFDLATLPHPVTWVEWSNASGSLTTGWLIQHQDDDCLRVMIVISSTYFDDDTPLYSEMVISKAGYKTAKLDPDLPNEDSIHSILAQQFASEVLSLLLELNDRSKPLLIQECDDDPSSPDQPCSQKERNLMPTQRAIVIRKSLS